MTRVWVASPGRWGAAGHAPCGGAGSKPVGRRPAGLEGSGRRGGGEAHEACKSLLGPHAWADSDMLAEMNSLWDACRQWAV